VAIAIPPLLFETGSASLDRDAVVGLSRLAANVVATGVHFHLRITGHADQRPFAASNHALGLARARAVGALLVDLGVPAAWMEVASEGAMTPARGTESTEGDRLRDRRVEIAMSVVLTSDASEEGSHAP
jgi:outer membrane protein OmpA-like peptidoglycan-associated protein